MLLVDVARLGKKLNFLFTVLILKYYNFLIIQKPKKVIWFKRYSEKNQNLFYLTDLKS